MGGKCLKQVMVDTGDIEAETGADFDLPLEDELLTTSRLKHILHLEL